MTPRNSPARAPASFAGLRAAHRRALARLAAFARAMRVAPDEAPDEAHDEAHGERPFHALARYLAGEFDAHLALEDDVLFPALAHGAPELAFALEPLREEHDDLRDMTRGLSTLLACPRTPQRDEQLAVLGRDLTDLARLHIRKEERSLLAWSERVLPAAVRAELERRLAR
jgi:hemerythrin-like domain-containing protein